MKCFGILLKQFEMREWLSGRALPCQGKCREFESRLPLQTQRVGGDGLGKAVAKAVADAKVEVGDPREDAQDRRPYTVFVIAEIVEDDGDVDEAEGHGYALVHHGPAHATAEVASELHVRLQTKKRPRARAGQTFRPRFCSTGKLE